MLRRTFRVVKAGLYRSEYISEHGYKFMALIIQLPTSAGAIYLESYPTYAKSRNRISETIVGHARIGRLLQRNGGGSVAAAVLQLNRRNSMSTLTSQLSSVPERKSSKSGLRRKVPHRLPFPPPQGLHQLVPTRPSSVSPVRLVVAGLCSRRCVGSREDVLSLCQTSGHSGVPRLKQPPPCSA